jgi:hypothetical protein
MKNHRNRCVEHGPQVLAHASVKNLIANISLKPEKEYSQFTVPSSETSARTSTKLEVLKLSQLINNWRRCSDICVPWKSRNINHVSESKIKLEVWYVDEIVISATIAPGVNFKLCIESFRKKYIYLRNAQSQAVE